MEALWKRLGMLRVVSVICNPVIASCWISAVSSEMS